MRKLDLKSIGNAWRVKENTLPSFMSFHHRSSHISLGMDDQCLVILSSWWSDDRDPEFLDEEMIQLFTYGQNSNIMNSKLGNKLTGDDYDVGLSVLGKNFFESFSKNDGEDELFMKFREFLSFDLHVKSKVGMDRVSLEGVYEYDEDVLDAGFGLKVASKLDQVRDGENAGVMDSVYGEFVEIFLQRLDFQTAGNLIERIDLSQTLGFDQFDNIKASSTTKNQRVGSVALSLDSTESGGVAICSLIDLMVSALNPLPDETP